MKAQQIYEELAAVLIGEIEQGIANPNGWRKPWAALGAHENATTGKPYKGFNQLALTVMGLRRFYESPQWGTFAQWQSIGAQVRKGERAIHLVKWVEKSAEPCQHPEGFNACGRCMGGAQGFPVGFAVFNSEQVDGYTYNAPELPEGERVEKAEAIVAAARNSGLRISEAPHNTQAFYSRTDDAIAAPSLVCFAAPEAYYATLLHELAHASGHPSRLNRDFSGSRFGNHKYAYEELVAEFGSAFLCSAVGIADCETARHGDYLANWAEVLKTDPKALATAASKGQQAADYWRQMVEPATAEVAA